MRKMMILRCILMNYRILMNNSFLRAFLLTFRETFFLPPFCIFFNTVPVAVNNTNSFPNSLVSTFNATTISAPILIAFDSREAIASSRTSKNFFSSNSCLFPFQLKLECFDLF